jgi:predicted porin
MQKKLMALAVAGALGVPTAAMSQMNYQVYGRANLGLDRYSATGSGTGNDFKARMRVYDSGSRLGFRGTENLGGGMEAYFVLENGVNWDAGGTGGQASGSTAAANANSSAGTFATRDSFLGLRAGWGEISWGRQSMFWANGLNAQSGANYINASADGLLTGHGLVAAPVTRQSNVMYYTSPRIAGTDIAVGYSPNTQEPAAYAGSGQTAGYVWNLNVKYRMAGLYVQLDHAVAKNNGNVQNRTNTGDKLGVSYGYAPGARAAFIYQKLTNKNIGAAFVDGAGATVANAGDELKMSMYGVNWEHMFGNTQVLAGYFRAGSVKGATGTNTATKNSAYHVGVKQHLSKRTGVYASYNAIKNEAGAFGDFTGGAYTSGGVPGLASASAGADPKVWGFGMMHNW